MSRTNGYKCCNVKCGSCVGKSLCGEPGDAALSCVDRIVCGKTNADRIRAMSDEELASIFLRADFCKCCEHEKGGVCNFICAYPNIPIYEGCKQAALAWMKQPVEVDT